MKVFRIILLGALLILCMPASAQNTAKSNDPAPSLQAYRQALSRKDFLKAVQAGSQIVDQYIARNQYQQGFDLCAEMSRMIYEEEKEQATPLFHLHFYVTKSRLAMYVAMKNAPKAYDQFRTMLQQADQAMDKKLILPDLQTAQAGYFFAFGQPEKALACYKTLTEQYKQQGDLQRIADLYLQISSQATRANQAAAAVDAYKQYVYWTDSLEMQNANTRYATLYKKHQSTLKDLQSAHDQASAERYKFISALVFALIAVAAAAVLALIITRMMLTVRKQKKRIEAERENSARKSGFIANLSAQMAPTLDNMPPSAAVQALKGFTAHIQQMAELENSLTEAPPTAETDICKFCEQVMEKARPHIQATVTTSIDAPHITVNASTDLLEHVLLHLLRNAAIHTPEGGRITLAYKKRGAHAHQLSVSNTGERIPADKQEKLFQPFSEAKDLTEGDGLGLPICALMAAKMNGSLGIDPEYSRGMRFVLEFHS